MPCNDADDCDKEITIEHSSDAKNHSDQEKDSENCTPFCMCACCGQSYHFEYFPAMLGFRPSVIVIKKSVYSLAFISGYACSIWKPPQFS